MAHYILLIFMVQDLKLQIEDVAVQACLRLPSYAIGGIHLLVKMYRSMCFGIAIIQQRQLTRS